MVAGIIQCLLELLRILTFNDTVQRVNVTLRENFRGWPTNHKIRESFPLE